MPRVLQWPNKRSRWGWLSRQVFWLVAGRQNGIQRLNRIRYRLRSSEAKPKSKNQRRGYREKISYRTIQASRPDKESNNCLLASSHKKQTAPNIDLPKTPLPRKTDNHGMLPLALWALSSSCIASMTGYARERSDSFVLCGTYQYYFILFVSSILSLPVHYPW